MKIIRGLIPMRINRQKTLPHSPASNADAIDMALLFGKPVKVAVDKQKEAENLQERKTPTLKLYSETSPLHRQLTSMTMIMPLITVHEEMGYQEFPASNEARNQFDVIPQKVNAQLLPSNELKISTNKEKDTQKIDTGKKVIEKKPEQSKPLAVNPDQKKAEKIQPEETGRLSQQRGLVCRIDGHIENQTESQ